MKIKQEITVSKNVYRKKIMKSLNQNQYTLKPKDLNEENETEQNHNIFRWTQKTLIIYII